MIVKMQKYGLILFHREQEMFFEALQKLSVAHFDIIQTDSVELLQSLRTEIKDSERVLNEINAMLLFNNNEDLSSPKILNKETIEKILLLLDKHQELSATKTELQLQIKELSKWGQFDDEHLAELRQKGLIVEFYSANLKEYKAFDFLDYSVVEICKEKDCIYFIRLKLKGDGIDLPFDKVQLPEKSLKKCEEELEEIEGDLSDNLDVLNRLVPAELLTVKKYVGRLKSLLKLYEVKELSGRNYAEGKLGFYEAWIPSEHMDIFEDFAINSEAFYFKIDDDSEPPVLLKNSAFARLFEPIGNLFMLPKSQELDMTPFFAPFFMLLFGLCVADAGYGMVIFIGAIIAYFKLSKKQKPLALLAILLGGTSVLLGGWLGTFFGYEILDMPVLEQFDAVILDSKQFFYLALLVGLVQIVFGIVIKAINCVVQKQALIAFSSVGWLSLISGASVAIVKPEFIVLQQILLISGLLMVVLFTKPYTKPGKRIGSGLWELYSTITGIFGDLLSYIRLFALGTASGILGLVINQMAMQFGSVSYIGPVITVLFLILGHSINIFLAVLGASVHSMRLTFVEFYKNAGFTGGGKAYTPFSK